MIIRRFSHNFENGTLDYTPSLSEDCKPMSVPLTEDPAGTEKEEFIQTLQKELNLCCGNTACKGVVNVNYDTSTTEKEFRSMERLMGPGYSRVNYAYFSCEVTDCPFRGPSSGDREPREPIPEPPILYAEEPIPDSF